MKDLIIKNMFFPIIIVTVAAVVSGMFGFESGDSWYMPAPGISWQNWPAYQN